MELKPDYDYILEPYNKDILFQKNTNVNLITTLHFDVSSLHLEEMTGFLVGVVHNYRTGEIHYWRWYPETGKCVSRGVFSGYVGDLAFKKRFFKNHGMAQILSNFIGYKVSKLICKFKYRRLITERLSK